jgi:hypothetical protein
MDKGILFFTFPIGLLIMISSCFGILHPSIYSKETTDWYAQTVGQDFSNLFIVVPLLFISAFFASKGSRIGTIIWLGTMITNVYSFVIYAFALHFNFLFHVYCAILGLSLYSVLYFFNRNKDVPFKSWFKSSIPIKSVSIFLIVLSSLFALLWLSDSLPAALMNRTPDSITKAGLLTNPVQVLDFSFYLPLMIFAGVLLIKKRSIGYLLAPTMILFAALTALNIISLMIASMWFLKTNAWLPIIFLSILTVICLAFLSAMLKQLKSVV